MFILPPTLEELERRLRSRAQDSEVVVQKCMAKATDEISHWEEYDYVVVNENVESAMAHIQRILHAERFKRWRQLVVQPAYRAALQAEPHVRLHRCEVNTMVGKFMLAPRAHEPASFIWMRRGVNDPSARDVAFQELHAVLSIDAA